MDHLQYQALISDAAARDQAAKEINGIARTFARKLVPVYRAMGTRWNDYFPRHDQIVQAIHELTGELRNTPGLKSLSKKGIEVSLEDGWWRLRFVFGMMGAINKKTEEGKDGRETGIEQGNLPG